MSKDKSTYESEYKADYQSDWDIHRNYITSFDPYEAMLISQVWDSVSNSVDGSKITDSYAATLAKERADRVMAKLPDGACESAGKADVGKAAFMDILRQKWYYPNANAQHPFLEKLNLWQFYSSVYGYMPMFYDWNVSPTGYVGPDCWLWNPRNLIPQQGRVSIADMDYVTALTWVSKSYLEDILSENDSDPDADGDNDELTEEGGWNREAIKELIERFNAEQTTSDSNQDTQVVQTRTNSSKKGICLATRYESGQDGKWCTFAPDHGFVQVREVPNPHKNGRIPFVIKYSQPLFDSFYGLGDFQRAKPLQFARDGLTNFYFKGIKMNLIPPIVANAYGVKKETLDYREGGVMLETIPNSIRRLETSTAGLSTYQAAQSNLTGSLLSLFGSQNASIPGAESLNPSQGKTPQAINLYSDKEATRDGAEVRHLEAAIEQLIDGFNSLTVNIGTEDIPVSLFSADIEEIKNSGMADVDQLFENIQTSPDGYAAELRINPAALKGVEYRFNVSPDSTIKVNKDAQRQALEAQMDRLGQFQNVFQDDPRYTINWGKIMTAWEGLSDIPGARDFIAFDPQAQKQPEPQPQPQPPLTAVQLKSGIFVESKDLLKMYADSENVDLKNEILQILGFQPTETEMDVSEDKTIIKTGQMFTDPHIGQAADALTQHFDQHQLPEPQQPEPAPEPSVTSQGQVFHDDTIAKAADALSKL
jgi:hypothetical protein